MPSLFFLILGLYRVVSGVSGVIRVCDDLWGLGFVIASGDETCFYFGVEFSRKIVTLWSGLSWGCDFGFFMSLVEVELVMNCADYGL